MASLSKRRCTSELNSRKTIPTVSWWCPSLRRTYRTVSGSERVDGCSQRNTRSLLLAVLYQNFKLGQYLVMASLDCYAGDAALPPHSAVRLGLNEEGLEIQRGAPPKIGKASCRER